MFIDKRLSHHFNMGDHKKFFGRLVFLAQKDFSLIKIGESPVSDECYEFAVESIQAILNSHKGSVYIAMNDQSPTIIKIGRTSKPIQVRERSLNSAGVCGTIKILGAVTSMDSFMTESFTHKRLSTFHHEKEFFQIGVDHAASIITECADLVNDFYGKILESFRFTDNLD